MRTYFIMLLVLAILCGCSSGTGSNKHIDKYNETLERIQKLEKVVETSDWNTFSVDKLKTLHDTVKELYYDYNPMDFTPEQVNACEALKTRVKNLREQVACKSSAALKEAEITAFNFSDKLTEATEAYPVYLQKGETLKVLASSQQSFTLKISNANSRSVLKSSIGKTSVEYSMEINNTAIYLVEVIPSKAQYLDLSIIYKIDDWARLTSPTLIETEQVECGKSDFGAKGVSGILMQKCFDEPRKFTLRGQLKAAFSGSAKALVAVQVPTGATDILYSMRIATSEQDRSTDGEFHENLASSYKKIKFLGLPLYEKEKNGNINLFSKLLDDNRPLRDEDAYCNMYVFRNQTQAKQFQDGTKAASVLNYDVDYSTLGTQSCNGRIPVKGNKTIYLTFENERMRYTNYLWVEAVAVIPTTVYHKEKYTIQK